MRKIQLRIRGFDSRAEDSAAKPVRNDDGLYGSKQHSSVHQCLSKIVAEMVTFLQVGVCFCCCCC